MNTNALRAKIRAHLLAGVLPIGAATRVFGGPGEGERCDCCGQIIERHEVEYEAEVSSPNGILAQRFVAHPACFAVWKDEVAKSQSQWTQLGF